MHWPSQSSGLKTSSSPAPSVLLLIFNVWVRNYRNLCHLNMSCAECNPRWITSFLTPSSCACSTTVSWCPNLSADMTAMQSGFLRGETPGSVSQNCLITATKSCVTVLVVLQLLYKHQHLVLITKYFTGCRAPYSSMSAVAQREP